MPTQQKVRKSEDLDRAEKAKPPRKMQHLKSTSPLERNPRITTKLARLAVASTTATSSLGSWAKRRTSWERAGPYRRLLTTRGRPSILLPCPCRARLPNWALSPRGRATVNFCRRRSEIRRRARTSETAWSQIQITGPRSRRHHNLQRLLVVWTRIAKASWASKALPRLLQPLKEDCSLHRHQRKEKL